MVFARDNGEDLDAREVVAIARDCSDVACCGDDAEVRSVEDRDDEDDGDLAEDLAEELAEDEDDESDASEPSSDEAEADE